MLHRGRPTKSVEILGIRELTRDDLACLKTPRTASAVAKLRDPHHALARFIAAGLKINEAAGRAGFSAARAYVLHADPTFQDLVAKYRKEVDAAYVVSQDDFYSTATANMLKAERQLAERLDKADEEGELLPVRDLIAISRDAADRFGYGKKSMNVNVNVDFAAKLEAARKRSGRQDGPKVIDGIVERRI
jgi:hypothetical protein